MRPATVPSTNSATASGSAGAPPLRRLWRWFRDLWATGQFVRRLRELQPRLVYVNTLTGLAALAAKRLGIPCIWHVRELFSDVGGEMRPPWPGGKWIVRRYLRQCAARVVAISRAVRENVLGPECTDRVVVAPNAVGNDFFCEARDLLARPPDRPIVRVPGTLRPVKGHLFFVRAARVIRRFGPKVHFALTGDGTPGYRRQVETAIARARLADCFSFLGTVSDMPAFYRACDVICIPSEAEAFGRTAAEAWPWAHSWWPDASADWLRQSAAARPALPSIRSISPNLPRRPSCFEPGWKSTSGSAKRPANTPNATIGPAYSATAWHDWYGKSSTGIIRRPTTGSNKLPLLPRLLN